MTSKGLGKNDKNYKRISMKKDTLEWLFICVVFTISLVSVSTLLFSLLMLLILLKQKEIGAIKILNLITLRTVMNPGFSVGIDRFQNIKWVLIFVCSLYLISKYNRIADSIKLRTQKVLFGLSLFAISNLLTSVLFSTLPLVAIFKLISYLIVFAAIIIGVSITYQKYNWVNWLYRMYFTLFLASIPLINNPIGYFRNGHAFQGITNQPNMLGIILALFIAVILVRIKMNWTKKTLSSIVLLSLAIYLIILSKSRTGLITSMFLMLFVLLVLNINKIKKGMIFSFLAVSSIIYFINGNFISSYLEDFLHKGQQDILFSRSNQIGGLITNFLRNPWFGSGFAVPVTPMRSFNFSFEYVVEPGNLLLAVLSYSGIIGLILFLYYISNIIYLNFDNFKNLGFLPISAILISMGEMVFFSSNNIGIWLYMYFALYLNYPAVQAKYGDQNQYSAKELNNENC